MSIRAVRQTPYKKYNGTAPTERTDTVILYHIAHVYVHESGLNFWPCIAVSPDNGGCVVTEWSVIIVKYNTDDLVAKG